MSSLLEGKEKKWVCLSFALAFLAMILFYFATLTKVTSIPADAQFGLLSVISPLWFISYALIIISVLIIIFKTKKEAFFLLILFLFLIVLYGAGVFGEELPRAHDTYWHTGAALRLIDNGMLDFSNYLDLNNYYEEYTVQYVSQSPGAFLVISNMILLTGAEDYIFTFLYLIPILLITIIAFMNYVMFKRFFEQKIAAILTLILFTLNVYFQWHISPFAIGLILFPLIITFLFRPKNNIEKYLGYGLLILLAICSLPLLLIIVLIVLLDWILCKIKGIRSKIIIQEILIVILIILTILFLLNLGGIITELTQSFQTGTQKTMAYASTSSILSSFPGVLKAAVLISFMLIIGILFIKDYNKITENEIFIISFLITAAIFFIFQFSISPRFSLVDRAYFIFFYGVALFIGQLIKRKEKIIVRILTLIFILAIINSLTLYAYEGNNIFSDTTISSYEYLYEISNENDLIFGAKDSYSMSIMSLENFRKVNFNTQVSDFFLEQKTKYDLFFINTKTNILADIYGYEENYSVLIDYLNQSAEVNLIYNNNNSKVYSNN